MVIQSGKSGYLCRIQIGGHQPIGQVIAIYRQRLRQAGATQVEIKPLKGRKIQIDVKKVRISSMLSVLLQAQGGFGLYRFVEDEQPLWAAYRALSQADQAALHLGPSLRVRALLAKAQPASLPYPSTRPRAASPTSLPTSSVQIPPTTRPAVRSATRPVASSMRSVSAAVRAKSRKRSALDTAEYKQLSGSGRHLFFGSSRAKMERALNNLILPNAWRYRVRFLWKRSLSQRFWLVFLVQAPASVSRMHLESARVMDVNPELGAMGTQIRLRLMPDGTKALMDLTASLHKKPLALALDDLLYSSPVVQTTISTGNLFLAPSFDLIPDERLAFLRAWGIILSLPALEAPPTILYVRRLHSF